MKKLFLFCLALTFMVLGCATPPPPSPLQHIRIMKIKNFQTRLLNETDSRRQKPLEDQYLKLVEDLSEGVVLTTMFGDILEANRAYQNMLGYPLTELRNYTCQQITPVKWQAMEKQKMAEAMTNPTMNLGNRYQISAALGFSAPAFLSTLKVNQIASMKATAPIKTFWDIFTIAAASKAIFP